MCEIVNARSECMKLFKNYIIMGLMIIFTSFFSFQMVTLADGCAIFDAETWNFIWRIYNMIVIIGVILTVVLGLLDFTGAVTSQEDGALKKASGKFMKRVISIAVIFLLPVLITFILNIVPNGAIPGIEGDDPLCYNARNEG